MDETTLYKQHFEFHSKLDYINTTSLSKIKEISKRINFASISSDKQVFNNKGNLYHREKNDIGDYINNLTLDYIIIPKEIGVIYGIVNTKITENDNGEEEKKASFKADTFNNYARFIADLISDKVIYSDELDSFLIVKSNTYEVIDETNFTLNYPVDNKHQINDFLEVMIEMYREHLNIEHGYNILPYTIAGNN